MLSIAPGWSLEVERGPDWLFVTLHCDADYDWESPPLAEACWSLLEQHFSRRLVLECEALETLTPAVIGELITLHKRIQAAGGLMRLCGLSEANRETLQIASLDSHFAHSVNRTEAVLGAYRPEKPR
jgi:anti-anti-sigma regulatory factor